jgi:hypothetical protein
MEMCGGAHFSRVERRKVLPACGREVEGCSAMMHRNGRVCRRWGNGQERLPKSRAFSQSKCARVYTMVRRDAGPHICGCVQHSSAPAKCRQCRGNTRICPVFESNRLILTIFRQVLAERRKPRQLAPAGRGRLEEGLGYCVGPECPTMRCRVSRPNLWPSSASVARIARMDVPACRRAKARAIAACCSGIGSRAPSAVAR